MKWQLLSYRKNLVIIIAWVSVIIWMGVIFKLSSQPAIQSGKLSTGIANINIKAINKVTPNTKFNIKKYDYLLRKNAHFFVYLLLGLLVIKALKGSGIVRYKSVALFISIIYAISDEVHQAFVPGRGPGFTDVLIDSSGAVVGILLFLMLSRVKRKIIFHGNNYYIHKE